MSTSYLRRLNERRNFWLWLEQKYGDGRELTELEEEIQYLEIVIRQYEESREWAADDTTPEEIEKFKKRLEILRKQYETA